MKKHIEKSKNVLEEMHKNGQVKNLHKKDQHAYSNCYEPLPRATKKRSRRRIAVFLMTKQISFFWFCSFDVDSIQYVT